MLFQEGIAYPDFEPILTVAIMVFMMIFMIYIYLKVHIFYVIMGIYCFSIYIWFASLSVDMPLAPVFQNFFLLIQSLFMIARSFQVTRKKKR